MRRAGRIARARRRQHDEEVSSESVGCWTSSRTSTTTIRDDDILSLPVWASRGWTRDTALRHAGKFQPSVDRKRKREDRWRSFSERTRLAGRNRSIAKSRWGSRRTRGCIAARSRGGKLRSSRARETGGPSTGLIYRARMRLVSSRCGRCRKITCSVCRWWLTKIPRCWTRKMRCLFPGCHRRARGPCPLPVGPPANPDTDLRSERCRSSMKTRTGSVQHRKETCNFPIFSDAKFNNVRIELSKKERFYSREFKYFQINQLTCRIRRKGGSVALGSRPGVVEPAMFPRLFTVGADTQNWLVRGAHLEAALAVIAVVQRPRGLLAGLGDIRIWNHRVFQRSLMHGWSNMNSCRPSTERNSSG